MKKYNELKAPLHESSLWGYDCVTALCAAQESDLFPHHILGMLFAQNPDSHSTYEQDECL